MVVIAVDGDAPGLDVGLHTRTSAASPRFCSDVRRCLRGRGRCSGTMSGYSQATYARRTCTERLVSRCPLYDLPATAVWLRAWEIRQCPLTSDKPGDGVLDGIHPGDIDPGRQCSSWPISRLRVDPTVEMNETGHTNTATEFMIARLLPSGYWRVRSASPGPANNHQRIAPLVRKAWPGGFNQEIRSRSKAPRRRWRVRRSAPGCIQ